MKSNKLYTGGTFDILHYGHLKFLKQCKLISNHVVVCLNRDSFVERYKGVKPIMSFKERKISLEHCKYVDEVIENKYDENSRSMIELVKPKIIAVGSDWAGKNYYSQMGFSQDWLDENEIVLAYLPYGNNGISTTEIKKRIKER
jgi:glycerol-3-phosphate cytidylyltransferase